MNQEFFREIGKCPPHQEEHEDTISAEKIYKAVTDKIDRRRKSRKLILKFIGGITATAAAFTPSFVWWNLWRYSNEQKEEPNKIIFYTYAARSADQWAEPNQANELEKKEVTDKKVVLGEFDILSNSFLGFPIMFMNSGKANPEARVSVQITQGRLLRRDRYMGTAEELGQKGEFQCGEEIYWSPGDKICDIKYAVIEASLLINGKKADTVKARLIYEEPIYTMIKIE